MLEMIYGEYFNVVQEKITQGDFHAAFNWS